MTLCSWQNIQILGLPNNTYPRSTPLPGGWCAELPSRILLVRQGPEVQRASINVKTSMFGRQAAWHHLIILRSHQRRKLVTSGQIKIKIMQVHDDCTRGTDLTNVHCITMILRVRARVNELCKASLSYRPFSPVQRCPPVSGQCACLSVSLLSC